MQCVICGSHATYEVTIADRFRVPEWHGMCDLHRDGHAERFGSVHRERKRPEWGPPLDLVDLTDEDLANCGKPSPLESVEPEGCEECGAPTSAGKRWCSETCRRCWYHDRSSKEIAMSKPPTRRERIAAYVADHPGQTSSEIAEGLDDNKKSVVSMLTNMTNDGEVRRRKRGKLFAYYTSTTHRAASPRADGASPAGKGSEARTSATPAGMGPSSVDAGGASDDGSRSPQATPPASAPTHEPEEASVPDDEAVPEVPIPPLQGQAPTVTIEASCEWRPPEATRQLDALVDAIAQIEQIPEGLPRYEGAFFVLGRWSAMLVDELQPVRRPVDAKRRPETQDDTPDEADGPSRPS